MHSSRKGMELPINIIVILIITIVIFGVILALTFKLFGKSQAISEQLDAETQRQIEGILLQPNTLVAVPIKTAEVSKGEKARFGVGIRNVGAKAKYYVVVAFSDAFDNAEREIQGLSPDYINTNWLGNFRARDITINDNDLATLPLYILAAPRLDESTYTKQGTYNFDICVFREDKYTSPAACSVKSFQADRSQFYGDRIERISVTVR